LSIKQVTDNPWHSVEKQFSVGQSVKGKVVRITNFGAFVELIPGVDGLIHVSEMSWVKKVHHPSEMVTIGSEVTTTILGIDPVKKTISLSLKDLSSDPWRDVQEKYPVGTETTGTIVKKSRYGYFIDLCEGVTGLLVFSKIAPEKKETLKENESIQVTVDSIDLQNRRISLSYGITVPSAASGEHTYTDKKESASSSSTEFGDALLAALHRNK
jgi:small subunit ribosomal protein S1